MTELKDHQEGSSNRGELHGTASCFAKCCQPDPSESSASDTALPSAQQAAQSKAKDSRSILLLMLPCTAKPTPWDLQPTAEEKSSEHLVDLLRCPETSRGNDPNP